MESNIVLGDKQVPLTFSPLIITFARDKRYDIRKRFHNDCIIHSERYWSTTNATFCASLEEAFATLCDERDNWWCDICNLSLFKLAIFFNFILKHICYNVINYCVFVSCALCMFIYTNRQLMCVFYHLVLAYVGIIRYG